MRYQEAARGPGPAEVGTEQAFLLALPVDDPGLYWDDVVHLSSGWEHALTVELFLASGSCPDLAPLARSNNEKRPRTMNKARAKNLAMLS